MNWLKKLINPLPKGHDPYSVFGLPLLPEITGMLILASHFTPKEIAKFCSVNKAWNKLCCSDEIWRVIVTKIRPAFRSDKPDSWKSYYYELFIISSALFSKNSKEVSIDCL
jgi:hypothetical protein